LGETVTAAIYPPSILHSYYDYPIDGLSGCQDIRTKAG